MTLGLSQMQVAAAVGISRSLYSRIENARLASLGIIVAAEIGSVLGLDVSVRAFPGPRSLRDEAQFTRLDRILGQVAQPLTWEREVALPQKLEARPEQRAWDAMIRGHGKRTAIELEMRIRDAQALERRVRLKLRDDPVEHFLLAVADTRTNRETLNALPQLLGLIRLTPSQVIRELRAGRHPPSGIVLV